MRYWWVNQNQTYRQEVEGGYLWSPLRKAGDVRNPFYEFMREVSPRDIVFSFSDTRIPAIGIVDSFCYESPRPVEFGGAGMNWNKIGWRVRVRFTVLVHFAIVLPNGNTLRPTREAGLGQIAKSAIKQGPVTTILIVKD